MNRMSHVAKMFGKKLGEGFIIKYQTINNDVCFTVEGLKYKDVFGKWHIANTLLLPLLTGEAVIVDD